MKALYKGRLSDVWEIGKTTYQPDWVKQAFKKNYLRWNDDDKLIICMSGINPSVAYNLKIGLLYPGYAAYPVGYMGDFLDVTNHKLLSPKQFHKRYKVVDDK